MEKSLALIDELIALETERDRRHKVEALKANKASQAIGESKMLFHLKALKELVILESTRPTLGHSPLSGNVSHFESMLAL